MRVLVNDPPRARGKKASPFVPLEPLLAEADIITLHVPLTREGADPTSYLFDKDRLGLLKNRQPILINTSRGAVVDNPSLLKAIDGEWLGGVVLDVWENEPKISPELLEVVDLATPHIAGYSFDGKVNGTQMIYDALCDFFDIKATWEPALPPSPDPRIELTVSSGEDDEEVLRRVVRRLYDITADDTALRKNILTFDKLRAEYPVRREFFNTRLVLRGASEGLRAKFAALEFKMD
jgi:erythronate-4-phosphate dehydrogenase